MKKIYMLSALLCASVFSVTGCIEENFEKPVPAKDGDEIIFGARAGFEGAGSDTKTVYTGVKYTDGGKTFERIDWLDGQDEIQIFCPQAEGPNPSNYTINHSKDSDGQKDYAFLTRKGDSSLSWSGDDVHHFYAMYPAQSLFEKMETTLHQGIKMDGTTLQGIVPASQPTTVTQNGLDWVAAPDMKYAYMAARSTATKEDGSVSLTFVPIVTALQVKMVLSEDSGESVSIAEIQVAGDGVSGAFTADLSETGWPEGQTYPACANVGAGNGVITISTWMNNKPVTVAPGGSLTFTVFLRPGADYKNLKISYSPTGAGLVGKTIGSTANPVNIPRNKKTVLNNLYLPSAKVNVDATKWMSQLAPETTLNKLSIPGTGGSFSYNYNSSNPGWYKQQTLNLDQQWAAGIRAFEIVSDRPSSASTTLGTQYVKCNKVSMGVTVLDVLEDLLAKTASSGGESDPSECAVLILTYQPEGNWGNARNAANYASSLKLMYDGLNESQKKQIIQYKPSLTLAEAKGKVMIFCRINQKDETDNGDTSDKTAFEVATDKLAGTNITLIDGCGTGKDRWGSRGYKVQGNVAFDAAHTDNATKSVDYYMSYRNWNQWADNVTVPTKSSLNFGFPTNYPGITCWYQEWARVVDLEHLGVTNANYYQTSSYGTRWYESYSEKVTAAQETFNMAISDTYSSYVFINSLCGYLVDESISSSYTIFTGINTGGIAGNIKALADKLNPAFYQYVLGAGMEQTTGPTGIVMMDYVTNKPTDGVEYDGSYYLPGVIISNNFKHGSGNAGNTGGTTGGGSTDTEGPGAGDTEDGL